MIRLINIFFYTIFVSIMIGVAGLLVGSMLPIPGNIELKIVKSGSMEPNIPTGSLVVVKPSSSYGIGDVITFGADTKTEIPTTHRIVGFEVDEAGRSAYRTKGDANEDADANPIQRGEVIGKVVFHVPYVGFVLDFARQPLGFALLIGVPAALVILEEVMTITKEVRASLKKRKRKEEGEDADDEPSHGAGGTRLREVAGPEKLMYLRRRAMDEIFVPMVIQTRGWVREKLPTPKDAYGAATFVVLGVVFVSTMLSGGAHGTIAYFNDIERSLANVFRAGTWGESVADPQNIVINEFLPNPDGVAYGFDFGNDAGNMPQGEWVELYNNGDVPLDLTGWYLADESGGAGNTQAIVTAGNTQPATTSIPAHGWLVVYFNKPVLNDTGDSVFLYTAGNVLVDSYTYDDSSNFCNLEPTPTEPNSTSTPTGTPGNGANADCNQAQVAPNKSYARIPDGTGAFVDPIPTPGSFNIPEEAAASMNTIVGPQLEGAVLGESDDHSGGASAPAESAAQPELPIDEPVTPSEEPIDVPEEPQEPVAPEANAAQTPVEQEGSTGQAPPIEPITPPEEPEEAQNPAPETPVEQAPEPPAEPAPQESAPEPALEPQPETPSVE